MDRRGLFCGAGALSATVLLPMAASATTTSADRSSVLSARVPAVLTCTGHREAEPARYVLSCADANAEWTQAHWSAWDSHRAVGHGTLVQNNCKPDCAGGHFRRYAATIVLSDPATSKGHGKVFTKAVISYSTKGASRREVSSLAR